MKHLFLLALLALAACAPTDPLQSPGSPSGNGTHIICEDGACRRVDGCPQGYDEYGAQVGPACIRHYDLEQIGSWPVCTRSSSACDCVMATRTTDGKQLKLPAETAFRCVPDDYKSLMVNQGMTGKDGRGNEYQAIA